VAITDDSVRTALRGVLFPKFRRDVVTLGMVTSVAIDGGHVRVRLRPGTDKADVLAALRQGVEGALGRLPGVERVTVETAEAAQGRGRDPFAERAALPGVRHVVAVASGKGGVGKSTVAANLAAALAGLGERVGLMDADVYGPSQPMMFGVDGRPAASAERRLQPHERHGVKLMSIGFFLDESSPVIWRGPVVMGIVRQFLRDVDWGTLDHLLVDLPPGTGDASLTLLQQVPVSGGVIVTTPQDVALLDVGRGLAMFEKVNAPVLGIVENMSGYVCEQCGHEDPVFGTGGAARLASRHSTPLLARVPLVPLAREGGDRGVPLVVGHPEHPASLVFRRLAERVRADLSQVAASAS
jgi:ATP-binding protein involved in chromosome partitioning